MAMLGTGTIKTRVCSMYHLNGSPDGFDPGSLHRLHHRHRGGRLHICDGLPAVMRQGYVASLVAMAMLSRVPAVPGYSRQN